MWNNGNAIFKIKKEQQKNTNTLYISTLHLYIIFYCYFIFPFFTLVSCYFCYSFVTRKTKIFSIFTTVSNKN